MPKKIDPEVRAHAVRLMVDHLGEFPPLTAVSVAVARPVSVGHETVRRWVLQSQVDGGQRRGATTGELTEIRRLKVEDRGLREDVDILRTATASFVGELDPRNRYG